MIVGRGGTKKAPNEADRDLEVEDIGRMNAAPLVGVVGLPAVIDIAGSLNAISGLYIGHWHTWNLFNYVGSSVLFSSRFHASLQLGHGKC